MRIRVLVNKLAMPCECASLHIYADFWIHYESSHRLEQSACGCHSKCPSVTEGSVYPLCLLLPLPFVAFALSLTASDFWFVSLRHSTGGASNVNCQVGISGRKNLHNLLSWISDKPQRDNRLPTPSNRLSAHYSPDIDVVEVLVLLFSIPATQTTTITITIEAMAANGKSVDEVVRTWSATPRAFEIRQPGKWFPH